MQYKRIKSKKIYEEVAETLKQMIKAGDLTPGDKLDSVERLAESFDVGRSAVREALSALRAMGLVDIRQGEGTFVKQFDSRDLAFPVSTALLMNKADIKELLEVRQILEVGAAGSAAVHWQEDDIWHLNDALDEMHAAIGNEELGEKSDWLFHMAVAKATHNDMLVDLLNSVSDMVVETMLETRRIWLYSQETTAERLYHEHKNIYSAIKNRDSSKAQKLMMKHLIDVEQILTKYLD